MPKPSIPQGTRDFGAETVRKRNYIFNTIREVFELYGFQPLETPAMENLETLMGKYGEEGDKLIFKILNNGLDNSAKHEKAKEDFEKVLEGKNTAGITERALRYDLTIPFARYVAMNHGQLTFPYKRYQMQPVWRADRPQKGRYREFYQCDADLVGSNSLLSDVEVINIYISAFEKLKIPKFRYSLDSRGYFIKINNRKILTALAEVCECPNKLIEITTAIDKLDKIGIDKVKEELSLRGLKDYQINLVNDYLSITGKENESILSQLKQLLGHNANGKSGIEELEFIIDRIPAEDFIEIDASLARGLNYYTGLIVEVKMPHEFSIGSIGGGGRYDDLTGLFGVPNIPGVGISFGVDRIYDVMEELKLFPEDIYVGTKVLFFNLGEEESKVAFGLMQQLRGKNISCELYHEQTKFDKQFKYADKKNIPYAVIIGNKELEEKTCNLKNLKTGEQQTIKQSDVINISL
jgi:histidyl-tRNA synthetase